VRHDAIDALKKMEKKSEITEDDLRNSLDEVQDIIDQYNDKIDEMNEKKIKDIMTV
jgi:ribosome recycling factor